MPLLAPTPDNFRQIIARHRLRREDICRHISMNLNMLTMFVNGVRALPPWAAHNIGLAINQEVGRRIFNIDESLGVVPPTTARRTYVYSEPASGAPRKKRRRPQKPGRTISGPKKASSVSA